MSLHSCSESRSHSSCFVEARSQAKPNAVLGPQAQTTCWVSLIMFSLTTAVLNAASCACRRPPNPVPAWKTRGRLPNLHIRNPIPQQIRTHPSTRTPQHVRSATQALKYGEGPQVHQISRYCSFHHCDSHASHPATQDRTTPL